MDLVEFDKLARSGSEDGEQIALMAWSRRQLYLGEERLRWLHHIPNGGGRSMAQGSLLKAAGVKPGIPDLFLPVPLGGYHGLWLEMKRSEANGGGKVSKPQEEFRDFAYSKGYGWAVCYGWRQARLILLEYLAQEQK